MWSVYTMLGVLFWTLSGMYFIGLFFLSYAWNKIPVCRTHLESDPLDKISVVIPVRDEAKNIQELLQDLEQQKGVKGVFDVIVVDDHSTDGTYDLLKTLDTSLSLTVMKCPVGMEGKKRAIEYAIGKTNGNIIVQIDGDCRVGPYWLATYLEVFRQPKPIPVQFVSGPVDFVEKPGILYRILNFELLGLIGIGAASLQSGFPNMANGANMGYRKDAFLEVGGHTGHLHLASGDDEFLLKKINNKYPGGIRFIKDNRAIVRTNPPEGLVEFLSQRIRWSGKWKQHGISSSMLIPVFLFVYYLLLVVLLICSFTEKELILCIGMGLLWKVIGESMLMYGVLGMFNKRKLLLCSPIIQLFYPMYALVIGVLSFKRSYLWKGRKLS